MAKRYYRSSFERKIIDTLISKGKKFEYEPFRISYLRPPSNYTPDIVLDNGRVIEIKGLFDAQDRSKHLLLKSQYPDLNVHFVFYNAKSKIAKNSKTTYAMWCEKNGFVYADKDIPESWL